MSAPAPLYPPGPRDVPADLAKPGLRYRLLVVLVLLALFLFLLFYLALMAGSLALLVWAVAPPGDVSERLSDRTETYVVFILIRVSVFAASAMFFAFLLKGLFRRQADDALDYVEVTEEEQPELYNFVRDLCREIGSPLPARVYLNHEVNAAVFFSTSLWSLVVPPPKNLLIGLGLVNTINVVELKALLAHEFGHFSQRSLRLSGYTLLVYRMIHNMVYVRDRWDNWMIRGFDTPWLSAFAVPLYVLVEWTRKALIQVVRLLEPAHRSLLWQMELNADLVAVSAAGSDAPVHLLFKSDFSVTCMQQATEDLALAAEHDWFSADLFDHQRRAAESLRTAQNNPDLGRPPSPPPGATGPVQVFQASDASPTALWADHPPHYDREQNAKRRYIPSPQDDRPAWLVFRDVDTLREEVTEQFYHVQLQREVEDTPASPERVQAFLDEERAALALDARFQPAYANRYLELGNLADLVRDAEVTGPLTPEQLAGSYKSFSSDTFQSWQADRRRRLDELDLLRGLCSGQRKPEGEGLDFRGEHYPVSEAERLLGKVQAELQEDQPFLAKLDRAVFTFHLHLAERLGKQDELRHRYEFHLELEQLHRLAWDQKGRVDHVLTILASPRVLSWEEISDLKEVLAQAWAGLAEMYHQSDRLVLPPLKHVPAGEPLRRLLPPPPAAVDLTLAEQAFSPQVLMPFHQQVETVADKLNRIHVKSLGGLLVFQEHLVQEWEQRAAPTEGAPSSRRENTS